MVIAITVAVGIVIALAIIATRPADAADRAPRHAVPETATPVPPTWLGGRIEMRLAGITLTYPDGQEDLAALAERMVGRTKKARPSRDGPRRSSSWMVV